MHREKENECKRKFHKDSYQCKCCGEFTRCENKEHKKKMAEIDDELATQNAFNYPYGID